MVVGEFKGTPGPWSVETALDPNDLHSPWVGRISENRFAALSCGDSLEEAYANAHLTAAAPTLLEAAQIALGLIESGRIYEQQCCSGQMCGCQGSTYADEAEHFLRTAISKALGQEAGK